LTEDSTEGVLLGERPLEVFAEETRLVALSERSILLDMRFFGTCPPIMAGHLCCSITLLEGSSEGWAFSHCSAIFFLLKGLLFLSVRTLTSPLVQSNDEAEITVSFLVAGLATDSDWKEEDKLRIAGHKPSGAFVLAIRLELLCKSLAVSRTGVIDQGVGIEGVETREEGVEGVDGLLLSADCALLGAGVPSVADVRPRLGDVHLLVLAASARPVLYLDAISFPRKALCFSDGTRGGLRVSSRRVAFFTSLLQASMKNRNSQNKPHQCKPQETSSLQQPICT